MPTNALNKIFLTLDREIFRYDGSYDNYVEKMIFALTSKKESGRFPDDQEFANALSEKPGEVTYSVIISGLDLTQAKALQANYPGSEIKEMSA